MTRRELLAFLALPRVGPVKALELARAGEAPPAWALAEADKTLAEALALGQRVVGLGEPGYPERLAAIHDAPPVIFLKGELEETNDAVAVIGTRTPTPHGAESARAVAGRLARAGMTVISGLALGVDGIAHRAALDAGGHTVAVLAGGLDRVSPREHAPLAAAILARGGALLSEQPPGKPVSPGLLVRRDRLQSGLAQAIVVVESDQDGGTLHAVRAAILQGRAIFAVRPLPGTEDAPKSTAPHALLTLNGDDLARFLGATGALAAALRGRVGPIAQSVDLIATP